MKIARNAVVAVFVALFFLVACNPQPGTKIPSVNKLSSTEKTSLLKETIFAFEYGMTEMVGQERSEDSLPGEHSFTLDAAYEAAYKAAVGKKPTYITAGTTLKVAFSTEDENIRISVTVEGSANISGKIAVAIVYDPIANTISYSINGSPIDAANIDFPDHGELLGPHETYFRIQFLTQGTDEVVKQLDLEYVISDSIPIIEGSIEHMTFAPLLYRQVEIILDGELFPDIFALFPVTRELSPSEITGHLPSDITVSSIFVYNFSGAGTYQITNPSDPETEPWLLIQTGTTDNDITQNLDLAVFMSDEADSGVIEISRYGEIGGLIEGNIILENITMYYLQAKADDEYEMISTSNQEYDVVMEFSVVRGEDLQIRLTTVDLYYDDWRSDTNMLLTGESYDDVFSENTWGEQTILGWSTEKNSDEIAYHVGDTLVVPDSPLYLYAVWAKSP